VPADWPDESDGHPDRRDDNSAASRPIRPSRPESGPPSRQEEYVNLRIAVSTEQAKAAHQITAAERAAAEKWDKNAAESRSLWTEYERRWPEAALPQVDRSKDLPGSWRGETGKYLEVSDNSRVEAACNQIEQREREKITPMMRDIESQNPGRSLAGFDDRLKGRDRIKEKVCDKIHELGFSAEESVSRVSDTIRYTFQYPDSRYTQGVWDDIKSLKDRGMELLQLKNSWPSDQYKGINSQWIDSSTGQRFEVQFHTRISFDGKQLTHKSYERLRLHEADAFEQMVLEAFQKKVSSEIPIPSGAANIPNHP
jgi:hypothetical protein